MASAEPAAGVYVHLPFCSAICPYCDFAVTVGGADLHRRLVAAVVAEIGSVAQEWAVDTIYFGGGTPSLHAPGEIAEILGALRRALDVEPETRIYLEANPEDVTPEAVEEWVSLGVRTLSLGIQALDDEALGFLGRRHTAREARRAIELARAGDVETVSVDLIYARPGQSEASWRSELEVVAELAPDHLSCYQLTFHQQTPFGRHLASGGLTEMPEGEQSELFVATHRGLAGLGYTAYEVSNFARHRRHRSRHNMKYWTGVPYLGFGPSAHSFDGRTRWWNVASTRGYIDRVESGKSTRAGQERLTPSQRLLEELMLGLRRPAGVDLAVLEVRYGLELIGPNAARLGDWEARGWIRREQGRLLPAPEGLLKADRLATALDPAGADQVV